MFLGHEKSVTWSGCEFEDVESWFYRVRCLIYWNMFGMTRILLTATAPSVRGWEILFDYTHIKKKRYAIASELSKFSHLSLTVDYIRFLQGSYIIPVALTPQNYWTNTCTFLHSEQKLGSKTRHSYKRRMQW